MLLMAAKAPAQMPDINPRHAAKILGKFEYGVKLAESHGTVIPEDFFYGQVLLKQRQAEEKAEEKPDKLVITKGPKPKAEPTEVTEPTVTVELKPATTPRKRASRTKTVATA